MDTIQASARFPNIAPDKLSEFKRLVAEAVEATKGEPGCLHYDWFFNADETVCEAREVYANSDAVLAHMAGAAALLGQLIELGGGIKIDCFGSASPALVEAAAALNPNYFAHFQGK